jgi:hypothetical protein
MKNRILRFLSSASGILVASVAILVVVLGFMTISTQAHRLAQAPFMKIHPRYSGGEVVRSFSSGGAFWQVHRPVFDGLLGERRDGFVQVDVEQFSADKPAQASIDFDGDGAADFNLLLPSNGAAPQVEALSSAVTGLDAWSREGESAIVRIHLSRR